uniref:Complement C3-like n=1 Tax=Echeneis naucrates TaxID=173247 RepID=A0A665VZJ5_ECHNA
MGWTQLCLSLFLLLCRELMSAPNLFRVGTAENVFVECQDCSGGDKQVQIVVMNHPTKSRQLVTKSLTLTSANHFQGLIPAADFSKDTKIKQYIYLQAHFPGRILEKAVLVSFQSGYIFIQTDKTLYTPNSRVLYRIFSQFVLLISDNFVLACMCLCSTGLWKLVAKFHSNPQESFSAEFEVKEYVLPSFEVKLSSSSSFFYVDSPDLTINIRATYLFGEEVDGTAYVVFGVVHEGQKRGLPSSLQRVSVSADRRSAEMVEAEMKGIKIVTSPYTIHFKRTPKFFKPGMSFDIMVEVMNPDSSPADGIAVLVEPGGVRGVTTANGLAKVTINTVASVKALTITAKTSDPRISPERQAEARMTATAYQSKSNNYIHIGVDTAQLELGDNMKINLNLNRQTNVENDITYLIMSKGQLVKHGRYRKKGQVLISLIVTITKEMLPSFRIIAYYHTSSNEVVSDSVWVDVKDSCMGSLKLESSRPFPSYEPRKMFSLKVTGDPGATVGLVAVDKGVYVLNNKHRLTQKKIWDIVEKYDTGCTPGGGADGMGVFFDAGLLLESSTASGTTYRQEPQCATQAVNRKRRATAIMNVTTSLCKYFKELQRDCCLEGMKQTPLSYSCQRRSEYISDGASCVDAFLFCCERMQTQRAENNEEELQLARSEADDNSYMDSNDIVSRTNFPESWLWSDIKLPACDQCASTTLVKNVPLQDSITTWQFTGISLSRTHGICVSDPFEVIVRKTFFIDLRLPYSAVRGEQLEIKAILHNYSPERVTVRVELLEEEHVCSSASKRTKFRQEVRIAADSSRSVPFIIIPMKEGQFRIEVKATVKDMSYNDGVMKMLRVVVRETYSVVNIMFVCLDPPTCTLFLSLGGKQEVILNSGIEESDLVPNTPTSTQISVTGREQVGVLVENAISGTSMGSLIYQPAGCGEQNMYHMTLPVIATVYLDKTSQWESVGFQKRDEALKHIKTGYRNELAYRKNDGSFSAFPKRSSCTWLTAYVAKVFSMASNLVAVPRNIICEAINFLIEQTQLPTGQFREVGSMIHGEMIVRGDVRGTDSDASMTAFCLIALQESRTICTPTLPVNKAIAFLEGRLPQINNPYAVAMTSYALANENKLNQATLYRFASAGTLSHWPVPKGHVYTLEATAYALLALVKAKAFEEAGPVVRWFSKQRKVGGGFGSTQATIMVYQAVAEYWANAREPEYNLNVAIQLPGRSKPDSYNFNRNNHYATRTTKVRIHTQSAIKIIIFAPCIFMVSLYYAIPTEKDSDCQKFNMSVALITGQSLTLYKDKNNDAAMSILDIGLLTGFTVNTDDLNLLSKGRARTIARYEMNTVLSERASLIIYLDKVSHTKPEEIAFRLHQKMKVGVLQPAAVSVYEYYDQTHCVKFYHPERRAGELLRLCTDDECTCAEENCSMQKMGKISNEQRLAKSCESTQTNKIDFVYKVKVKAFGTKVSTDVYEMEILETIKEGGFDVAPLGQRRAFLSYPHCRESLDLRTNSDYLIMGSSKDIHRSNKLKTYQYVLGETTWVEYWPTPAECQSDKYRLTCAGLQGMVEQYSLFGCDQ